MVEIGDILYVKKGVMSTGYDGLPVIIFEKGPMYFRARYQYPNELIHDYWNLTEKDIVYYLER